MTAGKALTPVDDFRHSLTKMEPQLKAALPAHITVEKFNRTLMTSIQTNPKILECSRPSVFAAVMRAAQDGLLPDGKEAAIVGYGTNAQYMPMVSGILKKVRNSGELSSITSQVVYEKDEFEYWIDENGEHLKHKPHFGGDCGAVKLTYALARTKDGAVYIEVMTEDQMDAIRNVSKSKTGPWAGPFADEMRRKSAIRRLSKRLPMSTDLEQVVKADDDLYDLEKPEEPVPEPKPRSSRLADVVEKKTKPVVEVSPNQIPDDDPGSAREIPEDEVPI